MSVPTRAPRLRPLKSLYGGNTRAVFARGLRVIGVIDNPEGRAALALRQGAVDGLSFGYRARGFRRDVTGRELTDIDLFEVSLVTHPMQAGARVHLIA